MQSVCGEDIAAQVAVEIAKDVYSDGAKPAMKKTGELLSIVPRAINAALLPLNMWIAHREYQLEETKKLLAAKLEKINPDKIVSPEAYIAVPTLQAISYSMDHPRIRDMYANLLAASMVDSMRDNTHPSFVEIIKQMTPDEACILEFLVKEWRYALPIITLRKTLANKGEIDIFRHFSRLYSLCPGLQMKNPSAVAVALDNLCRLGLGYIPEDRHFIDDSWYANLETDPYVLSLKESTGLGKDERWTIHKAMFALSSLGRAFADICIVFDGCVR